MNYFVTVKGETVTDNVSRESAIKSALKVLDKNPGIGTLCVGIGRYKYVKGKKMYSLLPCHFYFE